ncbi:hypothetical protein [Roseibium sp. TrichSKD4]|uniref:hypothetical protein n=1 Tax=Roseibium sp. TrichSKD4 TaxID=744980 RepID=UPI00143C7F8E|nr:hypothetical protein [Roseibium sp. TrichSKD4]
MSSMKISQVIKILQKAQDQCGDLPIYTVDSDIAEFEYWPCKNGLEVAPEEANEIIVGVHPEGVRGHALRFL